MTPEKGGITAFGRGLGCKGQVVAGLGPSGATWLLPPRGGAAPRQGDEGTTGQASGDGETEFVGPLCCDKMPGPAG